MSDPAIEAAQRALESHTGGVLQMADIAREALKPIRELHKPLFVEAQDATGTDAELCDVCRNERGYRVEWPCETAKLIYSAEELAEEFNPKWQLSEGSWTISDRPVR